jgi:SAM-dependent methyltransferase
MHPSSFYNMKIVKDKYLSHINNNSKILDVGGRGLSGDRSYKSIFNIDNYFIADIVDGIGVSHIMPGPYELPFEDNYFDLVVSGQMLEHCGNPFKSVNEMKRVLKINSFIVLIAPSTGPKHDIQDCWRFMDDAFKNIAKDIGIEIIDNWITKNYKDKRSRKWNDNVFIGRKI